MVFNLRWMEHCLQSSLGVKIIGVSKEIQKLCGRLDLNTKYTYRKHLKIKCSFICCKFPQRVRVELVQQTVSGLWYVLNMEITVES